jgi:hypothetical protein
MSVVGVHLPGGRSVWVDATEVELAIADRVRVRVAGEVFDGWVFVTPDQLLGPCPTPSGVVLERVPARAPGALEEMLPGADLPPLGTTFIAGDETGVVVALDPVKRQATLTRDDGTSVTVSVDVGEAGTPADRA